MDFLGNKPKQEGPVGLVVGPPMSREEFEARFVGPRSDWKLRQLVVFENEDGSLANPEEFPEGITTVQQAEAFVAAVKRYLT